MNRAKGKTGGPPETTVSTGQSAKVAIVPMQKRDTGGSKLFWFSRCYLRQIVRQEQRRGAGGQMAGKHTSCKQQDPWMDKEKLEPPH